jgi:hypothetical protein
MFLAEPSLSPHDQARSETPGRVDRHALRMAFCGGMRKWDLAVDFAGRVIVVGVGGPTTDPTSEWDSHGEVHGFDLR